MTELTTHVLDTASGVPAAGVRVRLLPAGGGAPLAVTETDANGRAKLLPATALATGSYDLVFSVGAYFSATGQAELEPRFLDEAVVRFGLRTEIAHYHVPLLISPFGYTTYRGQ